MWSLWLEKVEEEKFRSVAERAKRVLMGKKRRGLAWTF